MLRVLLLITFSGWFCVGYSQLVDYQRMILSEITSEADLPANEAFLLKTTTSNRSLIENDGFYVLRKLSDYYYIVSKKDQRSVHSVAIVSQLWAIDNSWKLSENAKKTRGRGVFRVISKSRSILDNIPDIKVLHKNLDIITVEADASYLKNTVTGLPEVSYIDVVAKTPHVESNVLDLNLNPNKINAVHHHYPELTGNGFNLSIQERRFDVEDIDLIGRGNIDNLSSEGQDNHATEVTTIAAGAGNSFVTGKGVAFQAQIYSSDFSQSIPNENSDYEERNIWVQNHSYGTDIESFYGVEARAFDVSANENPNLIHVLSAGNSGLLTAMDGTYNGIEGYANLTGNYKFSKNTLVVGLVDTVNALVSFASAGPAYDGRVKPELVAYSTVGSSNTAALVSGLSLLLQQAYFDENAEYPTSELLKAVLINTAEDIHNPNVDFKTGYGNVNGLKAVEAIKSTNYISSEISQGETLSWNIDIPVEAINVKVTVVWNDPASEIESSSALVNDLDLQVNYDGNQYLPWVLDSNPTISSLGENAVRGEDHLNNVEQVSFSIEEKAGSFTIELSGNDISSSTQTFSIVYDWEIADSFRWTNPTGSDNFPYNGETGTYFRWESSLSTSNGVLQYTVDGGDTWLDIGAVDLPTGFYRWTAPNITAIAQARMIVGTEMYYTDEFTISYPLSMSVGFNCDDSVLIQWETDPVATQYSVEFLDDSFLSQVSEIGDTAIVINKSDYQTRFFGVTPSVNGKSLISSRTFDYEQQGVGCYISTFFANTIVDGIALNVSLGTTYGVTSVLFERVESSGRTPIGEVVPDSAVVSLIDENPLEGFNQHQATIKLQNGQEIVTTLSEAYFLKDQPFLVFPNPVSGFGTLSIFSKDLDGDVAEFTLYNQGGNLVYTKELNPEFDFIDFDGLSRGIYFYAIKTKDYFTTAKIIVE